MARGNSSSNTASGSFSDARGNGSVNTATGNGANASGDISANTAVGLFANASGNNSSNIANGRSANASGVGSSNVAMGNDAQAMGAGTSNTAVGAGTRANFANSAAFGAFVGQPLTIRLVNLKIGTAKEVLFDNVRLTATVSPVAAPLATYVYDGLTGRIEKSVYEAFCSLWLLRHGDALLRCRIHNGSSEP